jgi:hypothetical protein
MGLNLMAVNTFSRTVKFTIPGDGANVDKEHSFVGTFKIIPSDDWDEMIEQKTRSACLREILVDVGDQIDPATITDPDTGQEVELSRKDVVISHPMAADAAFMEYHLYLTRNSRDKALQAAQSKNSKRSRR